MLLCAGAGGFHVRLADFGTARHRDAGAAPRTGTLDYMAPEARPVICPTETPHPSMVWISCPCASGHVCSAAHGHPGLHGARGAARLLPLINTLNPYLPLNIICR